jgi:hypothetical protein
VKLKTNWKSGMDVTESNNGLLRRTKRSEVCDTGWNNRAGRINDIWLCHNLKTNLLAPLTDKCHGLGTVFQCQKKDCNGFEEHCA